MQNSDVYDGNVAVYNRKLLSLKEISHFWDNKDIVNGYMELDNLYLESLEGCPKWINSYFVCTQNNLKNLIGGPITVIEQYMCGGNPLLSLEGAPMDCQEFYADNCRQLTSLEGIGKRYLKQCKKFVINNTPIISNILGLLLIKDLQMVHFNYLNPKSNWFEFPQNLVNILNDAISNKKDLLEVQENLISEGFKQYAKL